MEKESLSEDLQSILKDEAMPGSLVWHSDYDPERVFVKCKDQTWVYFTEATLPGIGKVNIPKLITKVLKKKQAKAALQPDGSLAYKFNFL